MFGKLANNLKKNLLWYSLIAIAVGWALGLAFPGFAKVHKSGLSNFTTVLVFLMIYPMMVNLNLERIPKVLKEPKPVLLSLAYNFVLTPLAAFFLVKGFIHDSNLALGFLLVMLVPGSSMSIGYAGLAGGDLEVATVALGVNFLLIPVMLPLWIKLLGSAYNVPVPLSLLLRTVFIVLILPMFLGDLTRRLLTRKLGREKFLELKPLLGATTMTTMLLLVGLIFFMKAQLLLSKWTLLVELAVVNTVYMLIMLALITWLDRALGMSYEEHMGIAFLSVGKNNGTAIAIATLAFQPLVAVPAATLPIFQIIFLILYLKLADRIRCLFEATLCSEGKGGEPEVG
ncbi:arsenic resistance protein [Thermococcus stetteri]|uniref:arsenic resistance protein n=1 Tax=Thermococcus stetteri TaxID=49900 RepID=UPI001AE0F413|nr:bile acid:sodium symporter [Thermococcus stetteri]MBP1912162.1 ACR3 family arsenite efflux pump ArsB [Thermococcus stetteri]